MPGIEPRIIALFCIVFIGLGIFNILMGRRRLQQARLQGHRAAWYKQISILTGIEYVLIALAFLLNISISYHWLPSALSVVILPVYLAVLISSGVLAGIVIYQGITNARMGRRGGSVQGAANGAMTRASTMSEDELSPEERAAQQQRRRERRQKAAAARRRRAGKA